MCVRNLAAGNSVLMTAVRVGAIMSNMKENDELSADEFDARLTAGKPVEIKVAFQGRHVPLWIVSVSHVGAAAAGWQRTATAQSVKPRPSTPR